MLTFLLIFQDSLTDNLLDLYAFNNVPVFYTSIVYYYLKVLTKIAFDNSQKQIAPSHFTL